MIEGGGYVTCPICDAEISIERDDRVGDEKYCACCQVMLKLKKRKGVKNEDDYYFDEET